MRIQRLSGLRGCASVMDIARHKSLRAARRFGAQPRVNHSVLVPQHGRLEISRRNRGRDDDSSHRVNRDIRAAEIRVIDPDGEQIGVMSPDEGREKAEEFGLDLVEVAPKARPPVCRIMDYGKYQYEQSKKKQASKSSRVQLKTVQFRPNTEEHDLKVKLGRAAKFIEKGNQVKFVMKMRGRERSYTDRWVEKLEDLIADFQEEYGVSVKIVSQPSSEGWRITAVVEPDSSS